MSDKKDTGPLQGCEGCRYRVEHETAYLCHRYPPTVRWTEGMFGGFLETGRPEAHGGCGERVQLEEPGDP